MPAFTRTLAATAPTMARVAGPAVALAGPRRPIMAVVPLARAAGARID